MTGYRRFGSRLEGHPTPVLPWVDVATGSLGQGLPDAVGVALAGKYLDESPFRVWVLCGDSEMAEGSIWEALDKASHYKLSNLIAMVDVNRLGQRGPTELSWDLETYSRRASAFGARVLTIDGHDVAEIDRAMAHAGDITGDQPTVILARTIKGRGFSEVEDREGWHGKPFPPEMAERAIIELGGERDLIVRGPKPDQTAAAARAEEADARRDAAGLHRRGQGRYPQGLRSGAGRCRRPPRCRGDGRRGEQLDLRRRVRAGVSRALLRDVHRRAAAGGGRGRLQRAGLPAVRLDVRGFLHPRLRLHPDGRHLASQHPPGRLARRRRDRRRRPLADGAGGPGHDARRSGLDCPVPERRHQHGCTRAGDGRPRRRRLHAHDARRLPGPVRGRGSIPGRRRQGAARQRRGPGHPDRGWRDPARLPRRRRPAQGRRDQRPRHRCVLRQADRHRHADRGCRSHWRQAGGRRGSSPRRRPRVRCRRRADRRRACRPDRAAPGGFRAARVGDQRGTARRGRHQRRAHRGCCPQPGRASLPELSVPDGRHQPSEGRPGRRHWRCR